MQGLQFRGKKDKREEGETFGKNESEFPFRLFTFLPFF
jgi:hypothetical protein